MGPGKETCPRPLGGSWALAAWGNATAHRHSNKPRVNNSVEPRTIREIQAFRVCIRSSPSTVGRILAMLDMKAESLRLKLVEEEASEGHQTQAAA
jgi:hypothetical protein